MILRGRTAWPRPDIVPAGGRLLVQAAQQRLSDDALPRELLVDSARLAIDAARQAIAA